MKYESVILKRLIETYGVVGNPRYISEIIKEFIVRGKECYPNLFTYQADWLAHIDEFGLNPSYTVSYTGQSIYAPNTLERPVKSAILKGNTLVNLVDVPPTTISVASAFRFNAFTPKQNTEYTMIISLTSLNASKKLNIGSVDANETNTNILNAEVFLGTNKIKFTTLSDTKILRLVNNSTFGGGDVAFENVMILEGDYTGLDIPYFTGMQSVKMPVLTTSNEDGTKTNILSTSEDVVLHGIGDVQDTLDCLTGEVTERIGEVVLDGSENGWTMSNTLVEEGFVRFYGNPINRMKRDSCLICDKLPQSINKYGEGDVFECVAGRNNNNRINVKLKLTTLGLADNTVSDNSVAIFKSWLKNNNLRIKFELETESIKTVDLTILDQNGQNVEQLMSFNGGTHFNTKSSEGSPLPTVSVSVETDLEKTLMVCSLEGNTM